MDKQPRLFISYSRANQGFALRLATAMRTEGFNIWLDQLQIPTGEHWDDEVERALVECEVFMILMTSASMASDNVKDEISYAIDRKKEVVPILLEDYNIPLQLNRLQYVDLEGRNFDTGVQVVTQRLRDGKRQDDLHRIEKAFSLTHSRNPTLAPAARYHLYKLTTVPRIECRNPWYKSSKTNFSVLLKSISSVH